MTWVDRKLGRLCARRGCPVRLDDNAAHCLCDGHRADHNTRQRISKRQRGAMAAAQMNLFSYTDRPCRPYEGERT